MCNCFTRLKQSTRIMHKYVGLTRNANECYPPNNWSTVLQVVVSGHTYTLHYVKVTPAQLNLHTSGLRYVVHIVVMDASNKQESRLAKGFRNARYANCLLGRNRNVSSHISIPSTFRRLFHKVGSCYSLFYMLCIPLPIVSNFTQQCYPRTVQWSDYLCVTGFNPNLVYPSKMNIVKKYHLKHFDGNDDH